MTNIGTPNTFPYVPYYYYPIKESILTKAFEKKLVGWVENSVMVIKEKDAVVGVVCEKEWESNHFGISCAMIEHLWANEQDNYSIYIEKILQRAKESEIKHLSIRVNALNQALQFELDKHGFSQMDVIVHFNSKISDLKPRNIQNDHGFTVREGRLEDCDYLCAIAADSYKYDRFHSDPYLSAEKVDKAYADWMYNSLNGLADKVYVLVDAESIPQGFVTVNIEDLNDTKIAKIWLLGVSEQCHGTSAAYKLFNATIEELKSEGVDYLEVGTQLKNVRAMRFYSKYGLLPIDPVYAYRKMIDQ